MRVVVAAVVVAWVGVAYAEPCAIDAGDDPRVHVRVDDLRATIAIDSGGTRVIEAATCAELADAVALVIGMAEPAAPPPVPKQAVDVDPLAIDAVRATAERPSLLALSVGFAGGVDEGRDRAGLVIGASRQHGAHSLGGELTLDAPESLAIGGGHVGVWSSALTASACAHAGAFAACGLATAGVVIGVGSGLMSARTAASPIVAGGVRVAWQHAIGARTALRVHADASANAVSTRFDVDRATVWANDRISALAGIDLVARFP